MASEKLALDTVSSLTVTSLQSLASSATAGWRSAAIDNTTNLFTDYEVQFKLDPAASSPANSKAFFAFVYGLLDEAGSDYGTTGASTGGAPDGTEGTLTFPDITANPMNLPLLGVIPYVVADVVIISRVMSARRAFGGIIPAKFGVALVNHSGAALAASGNVVKVRGVYRTVA